MSAAEPKSINHRIRSSSRPRVPLGGIATADRVRWAVTAAALLLMVLAVLLPSGYVQAGPFQPGSDRAAPENYGGAAFQQIPPNGLPLPQTPPLAAARAAPNRKLTPRLNRTRKPPPSLLPNPRLRLPPCRPRPRLLPLTLPAPTAPYRQLGRGETRHQLPRHLQRRRQGKLATGRPEPYRFGNHHQRRGQRCHLYRGRPRPQRQRRQRLG